MPPFLLPLQQSSKYIMKKYLIILLAAAAVIASCGKENTEINNPEENTTTPITFELTASHPLETRAVKTAWEDGDAIFVFFSISGISSPKHLKMTYSAATDKWTYTEYGGVDGTTAIPGSLGLINGNSGTMTAVFLPFGSNLSVSKDGYKYVFSEKQYTYYHYQRELHNQNYTPLRQDY